MDKKSSCTSNEQSGPRIARTSVAGSATNSNRATPTNKNRDPFIDPDATGESFLHSETKAIGIRDQKPVKSTFYQLYGHMYRITNLASHQENPFPTDGGSGIDPLLDTFEQSAVIMLNTGRKEESQETKQSAGDTLPIEAVASTAAEDIMFGTDNILQGIITQDIEDEHDLSNDSMFSSKSIHDDDSLLGESHSATPSAQLTTPHNNRTLPSMSVEMTPGTFFAGISFSHRKIW